MIFNGVYGEYDNSVCRPICFQIDVIDFVGHQKKPNAFVNCKVVKACYAMCDN